MSTEQFELQKKLEKDIQANVDNITIQSKVIEKIVRQLISEFCDGLDGISRDLDLILKDIRKGKIKRFSELNLEIKALELSNEMYKATEGLAILGSRTDVSKAHKQDLFNKAYLKTTSGTIPDKTAEANTKILEEILIEKIMDRSYTTISQKIKSANRILEAIKKIISSLMITKEVFRKESPTYDILDPGDIYDDLDKGEVEF